MTKVEVGANKKGALGEVLITGGQKPPEPMVETVKSFLEGKHEIVNSVGIDTSFSQADLVRVTVDNDRWVSWEPDAVLGAKWISASHEDEIECTDKSPTELWEVPRESARFPIEVKTGKYAAFERGQKETIEAVAAADNQVHPILVRVSIDQLPEAFTIKTDFF